MYSVFLQTILIKVDCYKLATFAFIVVNACVQQCYFRAVSYDRFPETMLPAIEKTLRWAHLLLVGTYITEGTVVHFPPFQ